MMHKVWLNIEKAPYIFQGHPSNFMVIRDKKIANFDPNWEFSHCNKFQDDRDRQIDDLAPTSVFPDGNANLNSAMAK